MCLRLGTRAIERTPSSCLYALSSVSSTLVTLPAMQLVLICTSCLNLSNTLVGWGIIPAVGIAYSGYCTRSNALAAVMPAILAVTVCSIQWFLIGYSLTYGEGGAIFGDLKYVFHKDVLAEPVGTIPAVLFSFFQLVFQATVCAIAVGGACERGRLLPLIPFIFVSLVSLLHIVIKDSLSYSYGQRSYTTLSPTWSGVVDSSRTWAYSTSRAARPSTSTPAQPQLQCLSTSPSHSSAPGNPQLEHPPTSRSIAP